MRISMMVMLIIAATAGEAAAADCGPNGDGTAITVKEWSVEAIAGLIGTEAKVSVTFTNDLTKSFRMIDASIMFEDALGGYISNIGVDRDITLAPGNSTVYTASYGGTGLDRVPQMNRQDVVVYACTKAVIYDDGTKQEF